MDEKGHPRALKGYGKRYEKRGSADLRNKLHDLNSSPALQQC